MARPRISDELWRDLNERKQTPEDSTEDVIRRLLNRVTNAEQLSTETDEQEEGSNSQEIVTDGGLPSDVRQKIRDRREGLEVVARSDGPFAQHADRLLELVADQEEVSSR